MFHISPQLEQGQKLLQTQKLSLSAEMRQSLLVLGLSVGELKEYIDEQLNENPMLEMEPAEETRDTAERLWEERELSEGFSPSSHPKDQSLYDLSAFTAQEEQETLQNALREQLLGRKLDDALFELCAFLIECLDHRGYLDFELDSLAEETRISLSELTEALDLLQNLTPAGVGARNLEECLTLQLIRSECLNPRTQKLVTDGLALLANQDFNGLARLLECDLAEALHWSELVRGLNPRPSQGFADNRQILRIIPDALVIVEGRRLTITLNTLGIPKLELSANYAGLLQEHNDKSVEQYLTERLSSAKALIRSVEGRGKTLYNLLACLAELQPRFFEEGGKHLIRPVTMGDVAKRLNLHLSTVSRTVQNKYIHCAAGTIPLRALFASGVNFAKEGPISAATVQQKIKRLIDAEDKTKPLSDEALRKALLSEGLDMARRTVAKYREELGISNSPRRKRR